MLKKYKYDSNIEKGKPYSQQLGRKPGKGTGHIKTDGMMEYIERTHRQKFEKWAPNTKHIKKLIKGAYDYYANQTKVVPDGDDIKNDVLTAIADEMGVNYTDIPQNIAEKVHELVTGDKLDLPFDVDGIPKDIMEAQEDDDTAVADWLSDEYGFCVTSLRVRKNKNGTGVASKIVWDIKE